MSKGRELRDRAEPPGRVIFQAHEGPGRWERHQVPQAALPLPGTIVEAASFPFLRCASHARHPKSKSDCAITWFESSLGAPSLIR